jgi:hypothetical protein
VADRVRAGVLADVVGELVLADARWTHADWRALADDAHKHSPAPRACADVAATVSGQPGPALGWVSVATTAPDPDLPLARVSRQHWGVAFVGGGAGQPVFVAPTMTLTSVCVSRVSPGQAIVTALYRYGCAPLFNGLDLEVDRYCDQGVQHEHAANPLALARFLVLRAEALGLPADPRDQALGGYLFHVQRPATALLLRATTDALVAGLALCEAGQPDRAADLLITQGGNP